MPFLSLPFCQYIRSPTSPFYILIYWKRLMSIFFFTWPMTCCSWPTLSFHLSFVNFVFLFCWFHSLLHTEQIFYFFPKLNVPSYLIKIEYLNFYFTESKNIKQELSNLPSSLPLIYLFPLISFHSIPVTSLLLFRPSLSSLDLTPSMMLFPKSSASPSPSALLLLHEVRYATLLSKGKKS